MRPAVATLALAALALASCRHKSTDATIPDLRAEIYRQAAADELADLRARKQAADAAREPLSKLVVSSVKYAQEENPPLGKETVITLSVTNNTGVAISRAWFEGVLASPGRSVPWITGDFNCGIPGGLEPGETKELTARPSAIDGWQVVEIPADAVLTVKVVQLDGADGLPAFGNKAFYARDEKRLKELEAGAR